MKLLLATAFIILVVTEAHHTAEHTLRGPRYAVGKVQVYDVEFNVTAGVQGLSSQVSKAAFKGELHVYSKSEKEHILKVIKVYTSGSVKAVENKDASIPLQKNRELESRLSIPIKFTLENGEVTSYTLSPRESLESKKIKKAILRSLEMHVPQTALQKMESSKPNLRIPVVYNITKNLGWGQHTSHYLITVSPDVEFPYSNVVYNISRTENFEGERHHSYKLHHNFRQQSFESAFKEWTGDENEAGCSCKQEPHQSPVKTYVQHDHHLVLEEGVMTPEIIKSVEVHNAKMYDQDMKVLIRQKIRKIGYSRSVIDEPAAQPTYTDLHDQDVEINEDGGKICNKSERFVRQAGNEISGKCEEKGEPVEVGKKLLKEISAIIVEGDLENKESTVVGEKIILLKRVLQKLKSLELKALSREITPKGSLKTAQEDEKVKRQIWMDILPLIGTNESVSFIVSYIKENIDKDLLIWEAKEILEALPNNIHSPNEKILTELKVLLSLPETKKSHLFHSASHSCLARVIRSMCNGRELESSSSNPYQRSVFDRIMTHERTHRNLQETSSISSRSHPECPASLVNTILQDIIHNLATTKKQDEILIYIDTLSQIGVSEVLPVISEYAYGTAENIQDLGPSYIAFVKSSAIYSLHSIVDRYPENVLQIVMPLYFNETECPKIRTAAFGVLIRCHPPMEVLQHIASHSWSERSNEVGSFVTSTMSTFGNSTLPCMQLTAHRIKQVMPLLKRFDIGMQHAKNLLWTYFDDIRMLGLKSHMTHIPNNASILPSAIYQALTYSTGPLVDTLFESALNLQGLPQEDDIFWHVIGYMFGIRVPIETIPKSKEEEIFEETKIVERVPEELRFTLYKKLFYSSSFYYLDMNNLKTQADTLKEYLVTYLMRSPSEYSGHLVKVMLPSSFHTVTIAKSLLYPVEFHMDHPVVLALKIESKEKSPSLSNLHLLFRPSVYLTKLLTHQIKNVGDCVGEVGAYHENKLAISYPIEVKLQVNPSLMNATLHYKLPELPKKILYYFTESGTYGEKKDLEILPSSKDRKPIRTLPSPLKNSTTIHLIGLPPVHVEFHTEDFGLLAEELPRKPWEVLDFTIKKILNAGWRYKSANISLEESSRVWPKETEVTFTIQHTRRHTAKGKLSRQQDSPTGSGNRNIIRSNEWMSIDNPHESWATEDSAQPWEKQLKDESWNSEASTQQWFWDKSRKDDYADDKWADDLKPSDILRNRNPSVFVNQGKKIFTTLSSSMPHITHVFNLNIETKPVYSFANLKVEYNHTYSKSLHSVHMDAAMKVPNERSVKQISVDHVMGFAGKPDEFQYHTHKDDQVALFVTALRTHNVGCSCPWKDVEIVAKGALQYELLDKILNEELESNVERKFFLSEHHEQCIEDIKNGHSQSPSCMKAIKERSIYNKLSMSILWNKNLPENVMNMARRFDTFMKHVYYRHMSIDYHPNTEDKIHVSLNHIDKLTEKPLFDVTIKKPDETVTLRRMKAIGQALSSVHNILSLDFMKLTNNTYPPTCVMMEKSVQTYDRKYYPLSLDGCSYILSTHCTQDKNFAIISKILSTDGTKELHIHIGTHTLILSPMSGNHYTIKYDNQDYVVSEPHVFDEDTAEIYVFSEKYASEHRHLEVVARTAGVKVLYDGKNVKIQIDPTYKGQTCGLCSEFDGETIREFRGIDRCLYSHPADFVNSAIISKGTCRKQILHPYICEDINMAWLQGGSTAKYAPSMKRNIIKVKGNDLCFSVRPVPVCDADSVPTETETLQIGFHCLPKQDITAKRMVSEAKRRSLGEIENKSVDYEENVEVAKMC